MAKEKHLIDNGGYFAWEAEEKVEPPKPEPMNLIFAKVMEILTYVGLIVMIVFGAAYLFGISSFIHPATVEKYWHLEANKFWEHIVGHPIKGYFFLHHLTKTDCLSLIGVSILALSPLISLICASFKAEKTYKILFLIVILIFLFAVFKPIVLPHLGGGH